MAALTASRDPLEVVDQRTLPPAAVAASTTIYAGGLVCRDTSGNALPAANAAGLAYGVAMETVDNSAGSAGDKTVKCNAGLFHFVNDGTNPVVVADLNGDVFAVDDQTVGNTQTGALPIAGRVIAITTEGVLVAVGVGSVGR